MKIAINCSILQPRGGGAKEAVLNLINNLATIDCENEYVIYVLQDMEDYAKSQLKCQFRIKTIPYKTGLFSTIMRSLFSQRFWHKEEKLERFDIFHSPFFYAPKLKKARIVMTVHDIRLYRFPKTYGILRYLYLRHSVKESISRVDKILASSQYTKKEIIDIFKVDPSKIQVVLLSINRNHYSNDNLSHYVLESKYEFLKGSRFLLTVGHIEPRKNYERLLKAFNILKKDPRNDDLKLVIVGKPYVNAEHIINEINKCPDVIYMNFVSHELLLWLYSNTLLFVFPSFYEGFGLTPLEAGCFNAISAVSNASSIPEVCGDAAAYFDPFNVDEMSDTISRCIYDTELRKRLHDKLSGQIDKFSWAVHAKETLEIYKTLYGK